MGKERYFQVDSCGAPSQDWGVDGDYGLPPLPWRMCHDGIRDALNRLILRPSLVSSTRGVVSANNDAIEVVVSIMNNMLSTPAKSGGHSCCDSCKTSIVNMQQSIVDWANGAFPDRVPSIGFMKLFEEIGEVISHPRDPHEWADVFIMLLDLADHHGVKNDLLVNAVIEKMEINRSREWCRSETGVMRHKEKTE